MDGMCSVVRFLFVLCGAPVLRVRCVRVLRAVRSRVVACVWGVWVRGAS